MLRVVKFLFSKDIDNFKNKSLLKLTHTMDIKDVHFLEWCIYYVIFTLYKSYAYSSS